MVVIVIPAGLIPGLVNIGALLAVDNLVYLGVSVIELDVISAELLGTNSSQGSTETFVASCLPGVTNTHLSPSRVSTGRDLSHILLDTELLGAGPPVLSAPAFIAPVHVGVGLPLLVQETVLVHTFVSFRVPRSQINRADFPGAGIAGLLADALVAIVRTNIGITKLVGQPRHVLTLAQQFLCLVGGDCDGYYDEE